MPDRRRFRLLFAAIVGGAGMFRVAYVLLAKDADPVVGDQVYYSAQAVTIANGHWFADPFIAGRFAADHAPMTALALAPVSWSDENPFLAQRLLMALYGTGLVASVGVLARWLFDRRIALVATALAAVYANFWMNDALVMSETFAALTVVGVLFAAYRYDLDRRLLSAALLGAAIGLAGLARAELLLFGPLLAMPMILLDPRRSAALRVRVGQLALAGLAAIVVISPWVVRNQLRFDDSVTMSTQDGLTLIGTNCPAAFEGSGIGFWHASCALAVDVPPDADQSEASAIYREHAVEYLSDNVDKLPAVVTARLGRGLSLWKTEAMGYLNQGEGRERWASTIGLWQFWVLAPLAAFGLRRWPSDQPRWPALVAVLIAILTIAALYGIPRFRIPGEIVVVLGAAVALDALGSAGFRRLRS